jgi:hypothetical protein
LPYHHSLLQGPLWSLAAGHYTRNPSPHSILHYTIAGIIFTHPTKEAFKTHQWEYPGKWMRGKCDTDNATLSPLGLEKI